MNQKAPSYPTQHSLFGDLFPDEQIVAAPLRQLNFGSHLRKNWEEKHTRLGFTEQS